ncbi:hypothetical protein CDN99_20710 [Roseateles aquatilis]|uniref:LD-carboxypeptidase n=1 Tax=Roseateles aquatilis TaxID=431061 RepID=A0A246J0X0_9BURK|nr:LD-carboxypeptidase [Roseateles aquatilis]OWQ86259.1 hypothetical protein CDN99_20710 [Roseateles aquatilis]
MASDSFLLSPLPDRACLGVIAPAGPPREGTLALVVPLIERLGFRAKVFPGCHGPAFLGHLAADDGRRLADLHEALDDPDVDAVIGVRGGYGCTRLLDRIDRQLLRRHPKPLIGYSDLTALHVLRQRLGIAGWHAPMPASDWCKGEAGWADAVLLADRLRSGLRVGDRLGPSLPPHPLNRGAVPVRGILTGGNLAVLVALLGTPFMPDLSGAILFLEDVAEDPYKIDRLLCQLRLSGALNDIAGVLLGSFTDAESSDDVLADYFGELGVPVLAGWPSGHTTPNLPLPIGVEVTMDVEAGTLSV